MIDEDTAKAASEACGFTWGVRPTSTPSVFCLGVGRWALSHSSGASFFTPDWGTSFNVPALAGIMHGYYFLQRVLKEAANGQ